MLKKKISLGIICSLMIINVGCQSEEDLEEEYYDDYPEGNYAVSQTISEPTSSDIRKRYDNVNKEELDYSYEEGESYLYEYRGGLAYGGNEIYNENVSDKKYKSILNEYTFASEVNPVNTRYDNAIELAKKILPDDIKEVSKSQYLGEEGEDGIGCTIIYYESSRGNFGVSFNHPFGEDGTKYDKDKVSGIGYMIEIEE